MLPKFYIVRKDYLNLGDKMPQCEMCGAETKLVDAIVEGTMLSVCQRCAKFGNVVAVRTPVAEKLPKSKLEIAKEVNMEEEIEAVVPDYSILIKKARERKGLKQEELARAIAEIESVVHKV